MDILRRISGRRTPQSEPAHAGQQQNTAGGYSFVIDEQARLRRFLTLGVDGGTYYTSARALAIWATKRKVEVDTFVVYTDNETWAGNVHPHQALVAYRQRMGIPARLVVVGMTATQFSIANPQDAGMLDVAGFDSAVPQLISGFARGL